MTIIGTFAQDDTGFTGTLHTLTHDIQLRLSPIEAKNDRSPAYRITRGPLEVGAAWRKTSKQDGRAYLQLTLDDPTFAKPIYAALFDVDDEDNLYRLVWERDTANKR